MVMIYIQTNQTMDIIQTNQNKEVYVIVNGKFYGNKHIMQAQSLYEEFKKKT